MTSHTTRPRLWATAFQLESSPPGNVYDLFSDRRLSPRTPTHMQAQYWSTLDETPTGTLTITDLSFGGMGLQLASPHTLRCGDQLFLNVTLNDTEATTIWQDVEIQWVTDRRLGASWLDMAAFDFDSPLGRYFCNTRNPLHP